ncbi:hypothetical protein [Thalassotalea fusca]
MLYKFITLCAFALSACTAPFNSNATDRLDYIRICDNCGTPIQKAKSIVPKYPDIYDSETETENEHDSEVFEYFVLVIDPIKNKSYFYLVEVEEQNIDAELITPSNSTKQKITNALTYYRAIHNKYSQLRISGFSAGYSSQDDRDCGNPGDVYNSEICQNIYIEKIRVDVLNEQYGLWEDLTQNLEISVKSSAKNIEAGLKYTQKHNTVIFNLPNGAKIAFKLNSTSTGVQKMDTSNSVFSSGKSLDYHLSRDKIKDASGYDVEEYLSAIGCFSGSRIKANYTYTVIRNGGSVLISVHTAVEEEEFELDCD